MPGQATTKLARVFLFPDEILDLLSPSSDPARPLPTVDLPDGYEVRAVSWDDERQCWSVVLWAAGFDEVKVGEVVPTIERRMEARAKGVKPEATKPAAAKVEPAAAKPVPATTPAAQSKPVSLPENREELHP